MKNTIRNVVAALALGGGLLGGLQISEAADHATAVMFDSLPISLPAGVNATVYLNPAAGGLDVSSVGPGVVYNSNANLDCKTGVDPSDTRLNATNYINGDIVLQCGFGVAGVTTFGQMW